MAKSGAMIGSSSRGLSELKRRLIFVVIAILIYRVGAHIPVPGLDPQRLASLFSNQSNGLFGYLNMFSGGALQRLTVFALGVMPYISASIIIQLFSSISPKLEQLKKEGEAGRRKINRYTRYGTLFIALFQSIGMAKFLVSSGVALNTGFNFYFTAALTLTTGTMFLMWLGEQMSERGIGNGISLIIFAGIVAGLPAALFRSLEQVRQGQLDVFAVLAILALVVIVTACVVYMERAQRRIPVNYAKRQEGRKMYAAQSTHLPLKINMSGVIPPIFASAILLFPATIAQWFGKGPGMTWLADIGFAMQPGQPLWMLLETIAIFFFCFFYAALVYNPKDTADNLKKSAAFIPGIRPGEQTANYIDMVMTRLTLWGGLYLVAVSLLPQLLIMKWNVPFYFGGTSLLIIVVVLMDFIAQIQAHLMSHKYESLMKKANLRGNGAPGAGLLR
jgi:preprotein translocase subunit SecY